MATAIERARETRAFPAKNAFFGNRRDTGKNTR